MTQLTLFPAIIIGLIVLLLAFWLFAPSKAVGAELNAQGGVIQWVWSKIKWVFTKVAGLFSKKAAPVAPAPSPAPAPIATILPVNPPKAEDTSVGNVVLGKVTHV